MHSIHAVVLGGGKGERLWPYSRENRPKQFLSFLNDQTLLEHTVERCKYFADNIWLVTDQRCKDSGFIEALSDVSVLVEPYGRNTAPAIALSCIEIQKKYPNAVLVFLPADHFIPDSEDMGEQIKRAVEFVKGGKICLLGAQPTRPATGYGYIEIGLELGKGIFSVNKFHEKPNLVQASQYLLDRNKVWNIGIFIGKVSAFIEEFKKHAPDIYQQVLKFCNTGNDSIYSEVPKSSVDCAIMEKSMNISILPVDFFWHDVGNLETFLTLGETTKKSNVIAFKAQNNLVDVKDKLVALVGIDDVCVAEKDGVLVVVKRSQVEQIKEIVHLLKQSSNKKFS